MMIGRYKSIAWCLAMLVVRRSPHSGSTQCVTWHGCRVLYVARFQLSQLSLIFATAVSSTSLIGVRSLSRSKADIDHSSGPSAIWIRTTRCAHAAAMNTPRSAVEWVHRSRSSNVSSCRHQWNVITIFLFGTFHSTSRCTIVVVNIRWRAGDVLLCSDVIAFLCSARAVKLTKLDAETTWILSTLTR